MSDKDKGMPQRGPAQTEGAAERSVEPRPETDPAQNNPESTPGTGMLPKLEDEDDPNMAPSG